MTARGALGTTATAARRAFDATRATSERASDDLDDDASARSERGATDRETCEARRLMLYLAAACYATARGGGATALRDEARRCADEDASEGNEWVGREVSARSSPSRSPSKRAMLRRANGRGVAGERGPVRRRRRGPGRRGVRELRFAELGRVRGRVSIGPRRGRGRARVRRRR